MSARAVVFDLFDTLVDLFMENLPEVTVMGERLRSTYGILHTVIRREADLDFDTFARTLRAVDREVWAERAEAGREFPTLERFRLLCARLGLEQPDLARELCERHMAEIRARAAYVDHHPRVLDELRTSVQGLRLGVCSNFSHTPTALRVIEESGLAELFDCVVISEEVGIRKPRPEIFRETLRRLDVDPADALHVGDRLEADVAGAASVGMRGVWITRRVADTQKQLAAYDGPAPFAVISDLGELVSLARDLRGASDGPRGASE